MFPHRLLFRASSPSPALCCLPASLTVTHSAAALLQLQLAPHTHARHTHAPPSKRNYNTSTVQHSPSPGLPSASASAAGTFTATPNGRFNNATTQQPATTGTSRPTFFIPSQHTAGHCRPFSSVMQQQIGQYARQSQRGVTMRQFLSPGPSPSKEALLESAKFCYEELPIRLAKRVKELESLPYGLSQMEPVIKVKGWYEQSFRDLLSHPPPTNEADERSFTQLLDVIYARHTDVVPTLAQGVVQMKKELGSSGTDVVNECPFLQDFLNRFHSSRIGIRLLISQHIALHTPVDGFIGTVATNLSPMSVIRDAIGDASRICDRQYGWAPDVEIIGDENQIINFVPTHLHHIMFELMKNSMRAVIEFHGLKNYDAPSIQVVLTNDEERYAIRISDQGGGIPRKDMPRIWSYLYTTTNPTSTEELLERIQGNGVVDAAGGHPTNAVGPAGDSATPMSGFGYGLPIARLYASYFGGDLNIVSVHGYGTDAYLFLNKLDDSQFLD